MGHSGNGDITSNYIGAYPLAKMLEYNAYLLKESKQENKKADLLELLKSMSPEERVALVEEASKYIITRRNLAKKSRLHRVTKSIIT